MFELFEYEWMCKDKSCYIHATHVYVYINTVCFMPNKYEK